MSEFRYCVAGHVFVLRTEGDAGWDGFLGQYAPFSVEADERKPVFVMTACLQGGALAGQVEGFAEEQRQSDDGSSIVVGLAGGHPCFEFRLNDRLAARMTTDADYGEGRVELGSAPGYGLNNALMVMFALSTACCQTALFHSSVVSYRGRGYMFLGKSGTGKSTHSSLWLKHIEGTELLNDDNPVVRIVGGEARVYGSPWSGKTPCYRNADVPIGAIVDLSQAPRNEIYRLRNLQAYAALLPSISGKRWDRRIADGLHETENLLLTLIPVWHLDCLPDREAALLCCGEIGKLR